MRPLWQSLLLMFLVAWPMAARAEIWVELTEIRGEQRRPATDWHVRHDWKWTTVEGDVPVLKSLVTLTPPEGMEIAKVKGRNSRWLKQAKSDRVDVQIQMNTLEDELTVVADDGVKRTLAVSLKPLSAEVVSKGCEASSIDLVRVDAESATKPPFYLGLACRDAKQGTVITVTAPKDVSWGSTTVFETGGKGEAWHQYSLAQLNPGDRGELGRLGFVSHGKVTLYAIVDRKAAGLAEILEAEKNEERLIRFRVGAGPGRLGVNTPGLNSALYHVGLSLDAETRNFFKLIRAQVGLDLALPLQTGSLGGDFFDFYASLKPVLRAGAFTIAPGAYFISLVGHYSSGLLDFEFNQPGVGLELRWLRAQGSGASFAVFTSGMLPSADNKFLGVTAGYRFKPGSLGRFGVDLQHRNVQLLEPTGSTDSMSETLLNLVWSL